MSLETEKYQILEKLGQGTYGVVFRAQNKMTKDIVALKMIKLDHEDEGVPSTAIREISLLKEVHQHPNVVELKDIVSDLRKLYLIFEFADEDLKRHIQRQKDANDKNIFLAPNVVKAYTYQILSAIAYCHENRVLHRDLKPQNILVTRNGMVKLADFGLARAYSLPIKKYTHEVVTMWYRAPEILLGQQVYSTPVDIWSVGCIFGEMAQRKALFQGDSEIDQLFQIFQKCGTPDESMWLGVSNLPDYKPTFPKWKKNPNVGLAANLDSNGQDLLNKMLELDPTKRILARDALDHPYFDDLDKSKYNYQL